MNLSGRAFAHVRLAWLILALTFAATACASVAKSQKRNALESSQYAFSSAIRWGDFEGAWNLIDPDYREKHPMSDIDFSRYQQVQVSGYRDLGSQTAADGTEMREVQIDLINRHNLASAACVTPRSGVTTKRPRLGGTPPGCPISGRGNNRPSRSRPSRRNLRTSPGFATPPATGDNSPLRRLDFAIRPDRRLSG
ncbi:MAG: hypothetical protein E6Q88_09310 [Lysobacteraceae bacterium]|nr:MAG: hypothetical protein E6Q88_09310 [Xanthomonadaceae bacterium]